jgi:hypothetical protein
MKTRLNLTVEGTLLDRIKKYASKKNTSVSELVESYFRSVLKPAGRENIINMVEKLKQPDISDSVDLKKEYYNQQKKKHGF